MLDNAGLPELKLFKKGKVRDVYQLEENLLIVATDRISCFDVVLPALIPGKGEVLTKISLFWFSFLKDIIKNHLVSGNPEDLPVPLSRYRDDLRNRFMIVKKCNVVPFECVVRGYLSGSAWKEYQATGTVCEETLPSGLKESQKLPSPLFTPATKAETGHDENISFEHMRNEIGKDLAERIKKISLEIYEKASGYARNKGVIIADTKFEFGIYRDELMLIDEVLTPDSSRFWPKSGFKPGRGQVSFDKQFVRDYLESLDWDKQPPGPNLPPEIIAKTQAKYKEVLTLLTEIIL